MTAKKIPEPPDFRVKLEISAKADSTQKMFIQAIIVGAVVLTIICVASAFQGYTLLDILSFLQSLNQLRAK